MKISALQKNYNPVASQPKAGTSFKGNVSGGYEITREVTKKIADNSEGVVKFLTNLGKNNGEILNTLVTAVGTAFVAPIFIAFNPISKEDKETKVYSALRQPISAVIALVIQIGVNTKFNNWLDKSVSTAEKGQLDKMNLRAKPQNSYLKKILMLKNPNISKEDLSKSIELEQDKAFWKEVNASRGSLNGKNIEFSELVDPKVYKAAKTELEDELKEKIGKLTKKAIKANISEVDIISRASEMVKAEMIDEAQIKHRIAKLAASKKPFDDVMVDLNVEHSDLLKQIDKADEVAAKTLTAKSVQLKEIIMKLENSGDFGNPNNVGKNFDEVLQSVKIKKLVKVGINNAEEMLKAHKKWGGIVISLATLPFSCGLLNWAYPRIMEKIMPEVASAKKAKEAK